MIGVRAAIASKSSSVSGTLASFASAIRCRTAFVEPAVAATAVMAFSKAARVRTWLGRRSSATRRMTISPARIGDARLARVHGRDVVEAHRRDPQHLAGHRHRVGGELTAAGAGARTGDILQRVQLVLGDSAGGTGADRFEDILDA